MSNAQFGHYSTAARCLDRQSSRFIKYETSLLCLPSWPFGGQRPIAIHCQFAAPLLHTRHCKLSNETAMASVPRTGGVSSSKTPLHTFELIRRSLLPVLISLARACKRPPHWLPVALDRRHFGTQFGRLFGKSISLPSRQNCLSGWGHQCGGANNHRHHGHPVLPSHMQALRPVVRSWAARTAASSCTGPQRTARGLSVRNCVCSTRRAVIGQTGTHLYDKASCFISANQHRVLGTQYFTGSHSIPDALTER